MPWSLEMMHMAQSIGVSLGIVVGNCVGNPCVQAYVAPLRVRASIFDPVLRNLPCKNKNNQAGLIGKNSKLLWQMTFL